MKKTSIVFLVIAAILIGFGFFLRSKGIDMAEKDGVKLFKQELTPEGDLIETVEFSNDDINKLLIEFDEAEITIIGNAEKNYVEIYNFNKLEYSAYPNNHTFNIKSDILSSIMGRAEGGNFSFSGVRDYVRFDKHNSEKKINIYITNDSSLKSINLNVKKGNVLFDGINLVCDYNVNLDDGNIILKNTANSSLFMCNVKKGNVSLENAFIKSANIKADNGNLTFTTPVGYIYDYNVEAEAGSITYNNETHEGVFSVYNDECNGDFTAHIGVGNVSIQTLDVPIQPAESTAETDTQPQETENA